MSVAAVVIACAAWAIAGVSVLEPVRRLAPLLLRRSMIRVPFFAMQYLSKLRPLT